MATLADQLNGIWKLGDDLQSGRFQAATLNPVSLRLKKFGLIEIAKVTGSDMRLRNFPRRKGRKARGNIGYDVHRDNSIIRFRPPGLIGLIESSHPPSRPIIDNTEKKIPGYWDREFAKQISRRI